MNLGGRIRPTELRIVVGRDLAVVHNLESGDNMVNEQRRKIMLRATSIFRRENGRWKMIAHHTDILPFLKD